MHRFTSPSLVLAALVSACGQAQREGVEAPSGSPSVVAPASLNDAEFKRQVQARLEEMQKEESVVEEAAWFGKTGLDEEAERRLPRYLRREFGVLLSQPNSLKARDLEYLGVFSEGAETVRYWRIHYGSPEAKYAYVVLGPGDRHFTGWGGRQPPK